MAQLRERETPQAKVYAYVKDPVYGINSARRLVEILGFRSVNSTISRSGNGSATVVFPNYKSCLIRYISSDSIRRIETNSGSETTNDYAKTFLSNINNEQGAGRSFKGLWDDVTLSKGTTSQVLIGPGSDFTQRSRSRGDIATGSDANAMSTVLKNNYIMSMSFINWMDPIFIDYLGQDGFWYAGFTGIVSTVSESYNKTGDQSITVNCRDLSALFDNVSLVSGWNRMSVPEQHSDLKNFVYSTEANLNASTSPLSNIFGGFNSVGDIIAAVVSRAQDMWRLEDNGAQQFSGDVGVRAFAFDTSLYPYQGISSRRGSIQRAPSEDPSFFSPVDFLSLSDDKLTKKHYLCDDDKNLTPLTGLNGRQFIHGSKKILVDPLILKFDNLFIHKLLNNTLSLYKDSLVSADQILNDLVAKMYAYKYFDGNGNLIIELARPNAFPNLVDYGGRSTSTIIKHKVPVPTKAEVAKQGEAQQITAPVLDGETLSSYIIRVNATLGKTLSQTLTYDTLISLNGGALPSGKPINTTIFGTTKTKSGSLYVYIFYPSSPVVGTSPQSTGALYDIQNYSVSPDHTEITPRTSDIPADVLEWTTLQYHGKNYVLSPDDFNAFTSSLNEAALMTVVNITGTFPWLPKVNDNISQSTISLTGVAVADIDKLAKLGVRRYQIQTMYNVVWPTPESGARILSYQAAAVLERINAMADTGTVTLSHRPELQLGRTLINPLRMKSYLIEGVTNSWSPGAPHMTSLSLDYGHLMHKTLDVPWLAIFNEPTLFFGADGITALSKLQAVDADGVPLSNSTTNTPDLIYLNPDPILQAGNDPFSWFLGK